MDSERYLRNSTATLKIKPNPRQELTASVTKLVRNCPPSNRSSHARRKGHAKGLFAGPTSIAYLFLRLSNTHPDLKIERCAPREWCLAYLDSDSGSLSHAAGITGWGIENEFLAYNAVKAAATQDSSAVKRVVDAISNEFRDCPPGDNEFFAGRAGALALLRIIRCYMPKTVDEMISSSVQELTSHILKHAPWSFHGKTYIGAAHGVIGIITQLILSDHNLGKTKLVEEQFLAFLDLQTPDGHWPTTGNPTRGNAELVQYCHGSPGCVISLVRIRPFVRHELQLRIDAAVERGRRKIWEKGLLRKEPNLCHGITGNMLALESWTQREQFMGHATMETIEQGIVDGRFVPGDDPWGLFWGEAGRSWGWMMIDSKIDLGFPGYTDI
jgi:Lanthionine synthetase C-like protein